jgi:hypothetical protein
MLKSVSLKKKIKKKIKRIDKAPLGGSDEKYRNLVFGYTRANYVTFTTN